MKPDIARLRGADVHERCPGCGFIVNHDVCAMGCRLERCAVIECRELIEVGKPHECAETCDVCPELVNPDARCTHGRSLCPECLTRCAECRDEFADDGRLVR